MTHETYIRARKALIDRGWIALQDGKIYILPTIIKYGFYFPEGSSEEEKEKIKRAAIQNCLTNLSTSKC